MADKKQSSKCGPAITQEEIAAMRARREQIEEQVRKWAPRQPLLEYKIGGQQTGGN